MMKLHIKTKLQLADGFSIPIFGIGTWDMYNEDLIKALHWAFENGYRHIDTASYYKNEKEVGEAIRTSKIDREKLYLTTKVFPDEFGFEPAKEAFQRSFEKLDIDYIDLYLVHWPSNKKKTEETWKALLDLVKDDRLRSIGVSSFSESQLENLKDLGDVIPVTNQVEFHPYDFDPELLEYCKTEKITITAYSPLVVGKKLRDPRLLEIGGHYKKTPAQILIRWGLQKGVIEIPKSSNEDRIIENSQIFDFEIDKNDIDELDNF